jgi:aminopeptidase N
MRTEEPRAIHLADYKAPDFRIESVHLDFALEPEATRVTAKMIVARRSSGQEKWEPAQQASGFPSAARPK